MEKVQLPIAEHAERIVAALREHPVVLLTGETGSGKTTQLPQILAGSDAVAAGAWRARPGEKVRVVCAQPHRVAAMSVARHVADQLHTEVGGDLVGYAVRWDHKCQPTTAIKYCTDGVLLRESLSGRWQYDIVVLDEAHERTLNMDLLLAICKRQITRKFAKLAPSQIPIRFIVTSATLNVEKLAAFFDNPPIINIPGRSYHVTVKHVPVLRDDTDQRRRRAEDDADWLSSGAAVAASVALACRIHVKTSVQESGHILSFLSGAQECEQAVKDTQKRLGEMAEQGEEFAPAVVIPLYGNLDAKQQSAVFVEVPAHVRKIIYSTNIAETSVTIAGVGHVIDSGTVKQTFFRQGVVSLERMAISRAQAKQRAGRAGRTRDGYCWRLYAEEMYEAMVEDPVPEILRSNPSTALLYLLSMNIKDVLGFEFIDSPNRKELALGLRELVVLGAVRCARGKLHVTDIGWAMVKLPIEPMLSRCIIAAISYGVVPEVAAIVSMLSAGGPIILAPKPPPPKVRKKPDDQAFSHQASSDEGSDDEDSSSSSDEEPQITPHQLVQEALGPLRQAGSDHLTYLNIFREYNRQNGKVEWCLGHFLSAKALAASARIQMQLLEAVLDIEGDDMGSRPLNELSPEDRVLLSLAQGLFLTVAKHVPSRSKWCNWASVRDGTVIQAASESVLADYSHDANLSPPSWILSGMLQRNEGATITRCASGINYKWIRDLLERLRQVSLEDCLDGLERNDGDRDIWRDERDIRLEEIVAKQALDKPSTAVDREEKTRLARERLMQRKKARLEAS